MLSVYRSKSIVALTFRTLSVGHGTHVAGTIAALAGNNIGVVGGGNFRLHITRALGDDGRGYESDVRRAVSQCIAAGSNIINLSLGGPFMSNTSSALYTHAVEELGILMIAAAGNEGSNNYFYPASHPSVISVAAVYEWGMYWGGSNWGDQIEMAGPGYNILSSTVSSRSVQTEELGYAAFDITGRGTSTGNLTYCGQGDFVCDEAAGGICLLLRESGNLTTMLSNCQEGGAVGAVVYPGERSSHDDWTPLSNVTIQAVRVSWEIGTELDTNKRNTSVTIGDITADVQEYTYSLFTGTSMASPHVAAAAALAWSYNLANCTNHQIRYALAKTALDLDPTQQPGCDNDHGYGLVQALTAKEWLAVNNCSTWEVPAGAVGGCTILGENVTLTV
jgi:serine protease